MRTEISALRLVPLALILSAASGLAQTMPQQRTVGLTDSGSSLTISAVDVENLAVLGKAAGVPMGFEGLSPLRHALSIPATKRPLGVVLDAIVAADPRYSWRELDGVIVVRPVERWFDLASPLNSPIDGFRADNISGTEALDVIAQWADLRPGGSGLESQRFSVDVPDGSTWMEGLNAIVKGHGTLMWSIAPLFPPSPAAPLAISLSLGRTSAGRGIHWGARLNPSVAGPSEATVPTPVEAETLDRPVGSRPGALPMTAASPNVYLMSSLAKEARALIGFQALPAREPRFSNSPPILLNGLTLREALNMLVLVDARFEWRDMGGVIVMRPAVAWSDSQDFLSRFVQKVELRDGTLVEAVGAVERLLTGARTINEFPDSRKFSLSLPPGSLIDLLNEISRAHGELSWTYEEIPSPEKPFNKPGRNREIGFLLPDGVGLSIPRP